MRRAVSNNVGLYLEAHQGYDLRLVLKGEGQPVDVKLGNKTWTIPAVAEDWTTYEQTLTPTQLDVDGVLSITITTGNLWIGCASLMPDNHVKGHRADVIEALKAWRPRFIRWSAGLNTSSYRWIDAIGDRDKRPSYQNAQTGEWEPNDVGTNEFIELCELLTVEPALTVNVAHKPEEAAAWVQYCNGAESTKYGALRKSHGKAEPYNVSTWFIGYEPYRNEQVGHLHAEAYAKKLVEFSKTMRGIDADILIVGAGVPTNLYGHWNEFVLKQAGKSIDELSVKYHAINANVKDIEDDTLYLAKVGAAHEAVTVLDKTWEKVKGMTDPPIPLAFDSWNIMLESASEDEHVPSTIGDALYAGSVMNACLNRCDHIQMSAIYSLINQHGCFRVTPTTLWKTPTTMVLELMADHRGEVALASTVTSPKLHTPTLGTLSANQDMPMLSVSATFQPDVNLLYLAVVNRDPEQIAFLQVDGLKRLGNAALYSVAGITTSSTNTADEPNAVEVWKSIWRPETETLDILPHSFTMAVIPISPPETES